MGTKKGLQAGHLCGQISILGKLLYRHVYNRFKRDKTEGRETCQEAAAIDKVRWLIFGTINVCNQMILSEFFCVVGGKCVVYRMFCSFPGLYSLDNRSIHFSTPRCDN